MLELPAVFRRGRPPGRALVRLMRRALAYFQAERGLLVLRDPESGRFFTWDVARRRGRMRVALRITDTDPLPLPFAAETEGLLVNDVRPATGTALCYDVLSGAVQRKAIVPPLALPDPRTAQALIIAPVLIQRELRGHAIVIREAQRKFTRDELEFLLLLVGQAAAGFENVRLQEKAEEYAVARSAGASRATCTTASSSRSPASTCESRRASCSCGAIRRACRASSRSCIRPSTAATARCGTT